MKKKGKREAPTNGGKGILRRGGNWISVRGTPSKGKWAKRKVSKRGDTRQSGCRIESPTFCKTRTQTGRIWSKGPWGKLEVGKLGGWRLQRGTTSMEQRKKKGTKHDRRRKKSNEDAKAQRGRRIKNSCYEQDTSCCKKKK